MGILEYILVMSKEASLVLVPIFIPVKSSLYLSEFLCWMHDINLLFHLVIVYKIWLNYMPGHFSNLGLMETMSLWTFIRYLIFGEVGYKLIPPPPWVIKDLLLLKSVCNYL